jgi:hypothetical protein
MRERERERERERFWLKWDMGIVVLHASSE